MKRPSPTCNLCQKNFKSICGYKEHMLIHCIDVKLYNCPHCNQQFSKKQRLLDHIKTLGYGDYNRARDTIKSTSYLNQVRLKEFVYIYDFHCVSGGQNYLLFGGMCRRCLKYTETDTHKCTEKNLNFRFCIMCGIDISDTNFFKHALSSSCKRDKQKPLTQNHIYQNLLNK